VGITSWASFGTGTVTGGEPPSLEQRVAALEEGVWPAIEEVQRQALDSANARTDSAVEAVRSTAQRDTDELRGLLLRVTEPNWKVWTSLVLIVGGLTLQTVASALGVMAQP
jgi:hypothetical protein